jgi:excisionase family DNA binding protein
MSASEPLGTPAGVLASALVEALAADPAAISRLRELVAVELPHPIAPEPVIYTVASLAAVLDVSERVVRGAIARGELQAAKRGGRYLISAGAVRDWAAVEPGAKSERPGRAQLRRAHGPLRTALDTLDKRTAAGG